MFEGVVAYLLNKYLGKYIDDLDSEELNVGIFSGTVQLTELKLKPEALYELDLPIEVKAGCVSKISIDIPWTTLYSDPLLIHVEDVLILVGPITDGPYDAEREKRLMRARKKKQLEDVHVATNDSGFSDHPQGFFENLAATIVNNVQVSIQNVHIRYEDTVTDPRRPFACGLALQNLTAITTNNKWKPTQIEGDAKNIFKLVKVESLSLYWNPSCLLSNLLKTQVQSNMWKIALKKGLATFSINGDDFDFLVKPVSAKVKMIFNKSGEAKVPKLLLDFVLQDAASQLSKEQYISMLDLTESFQRMELNRRYRKYHPGVAVKGQEMKWWDYFCTAVLEEYVRPYSWERIKDHRKKYRRYKEMYKEYLHRPNDTELKLDLQQLEDHLDVLNVLIATEEAKLEVAKEEPNMVRKAAKEKSWWESWFGGESIEQGPKEEIKVVGEREKTLWSRLSTEEKEKLYEGIGFYDSKSPSEIPLQYIAHKLNFTLANCTLSMFNCEKEILVITLTQFLTSFETRPGGKAFKISARTEGFVVEGASIENDLVPIMTADNIISGSSFAHVFALDFEKNPLHVNADYGLTIHAEPMEVVYYEHAVSELASFFKVPNVTYTDMKKFATDKLSSLAEISKSSLMSALSKHKTVHLSMDLKSPYFVIPEHGSLQKGGSVLIVDTGRLSVNSELQPETTGLEDATKMEIEERLYDRFNVVLSDMQVLFSDSGDEWRVAKQLPESDIHLMPKVRIQVLFSNSVKPDYKLLPRQKLNISVPSLKLNLSDRRVRLLTEFVNNLPLPKLPATDSADGKKIVQLSSESVKKYGLLEYTPNRLRELKSVVSCPKYYDDNTKHSRSSTDVSIPGSERCYSTSDHSDDEPEEWARVVDLPGFDDNVSPSNTINILIRFIVGEVVVHLARSSDHVDKPYLMLRAEKLCTDVALMVYGPALQASLGQVQLVDKLHTGSSGEYLELISSKDKADMITILYRKVRANCPEFRSHFHQVEHSLVIDLTSLSVTFHREAFMTLGRFLLYVWAKFKPKDQTRKSILPDVVPGPTYSVFIGPNDPPVPSGATKFSISAHLDNIQIKLCDTDLELADLTVSGLECDYVLKANDRMTLRIDLTDLSVEDLMESTLYSKILSIEDDKVFDIKYVKHSSHHKEVGSDDDTPTHKDGSIRLRIGRMQVVLLYKFFGELQRFFEPFIQPDMTAVAKKSAENMVQQQVSEFKKHGLRLHLSVDIHAPTILIPQKSSSPNLLVLNLGDLSVENFFKDVHLPANNKHIIDNILLRLSSLQMSRAIILLDGSMESQEPILEPMKLRLDIKRSLPPHCKEVLLYDVQGSMDLIKVNVGQRDLSTIISIYQENMTEGEWPDSRKMGSTPVSPVEAASPTRNEDPVKKLEAFLSTSTDVHKATNVSFIMEGMNLTLYTDGEEIFSSPVRDPSHALSKFELDEVSISISVSNDKSLEMKCSLQAATLEDVRPESTLAMRKIFQSYSGDCQPGPGICGISISMPPMVDLTYRQTGNGDAAVDILVEKTRFNVSVPYILAIIKFVYDALPGKHDDLQVIQEGGPASIAVQQGKVFVMDQVRHRRLPSDSTSGYHSTVSAPEEAKGLSISAVLKKPEVILFADPMDINSQVLVLKTDVMFDYSRTIGQENIMASVAGLHILSCVYGKRRQTMRVVLYPCEAHFSKTQKFAEDEVRILASLSSVEVCLSAPIVHTVMDVVEELVSNVKEATAHENSTSQQDSKDRQDLWSPKKITPQKWIMRPDETVICMKPTYPTTKSQEVFNISIPELQVLCELVDGTRKVPVLYMKTSLETEIHDWSKQVYLNGELQMEMMYYNEKLSTWEPLIEPVMERENFYRPWEILFKVFRDRSHPIKCHHGDKETVLLADIVDGDTKSVTSRAVSESSSSDDDTEEEGGMTVIRRHAAPRTKRLASMKSHDSGSLVAYPPDSDSENEDGILEKIASTFGHLFSDESSDEEPSDSEVVADVDVKSDSGDTETADNEGSSDDHPVFLFSGKDREDTVDSVIEDLPAASQWATYAIIDSQNTLNLNITPTAINTIQEVISEFTKRPPDRNYTVTSENGKSLVLNNFLGPEATVAVLKKEEDSQSYQIIEEVVGKGASPSPSSPNVTAQLVDITPPDSDVEMTGDETDGFSISSTLVSSKRSNLSAESSSFMELAVSELYKETTKERISIQVEGFDKLQCLLPRRATTVMYALHPTKNKTRYYLVLDVDVYRGRKIVTVRSPLQIHNHLSRPVHVMCQKAIIEAVGALPAAYTTNPFHDKYIRLHTLDIGQVYTVPLYVAYHCNIFLQPVSAPDETEVYNISTEGLWWQDITVSQKNSKFLQCPKNDTSSTKFCIKCVCTENKDVKTPSVGTKLVPNYTLQFHPPVIIHNALPYPLELHFKNQTQQIKLEEGESVPMFHIEPHNPQDVTVEIMQYYSIPWRGKLELAADLEEHRTIIMEPESDTEGGNKHLGLSVHLSHESSLDLYLFAPYWITNKTGLPLQLRGVSSDVIYETATDEPLLFRFKKHKRKKAKVRVYSSHWSRGFSLDTVGNNGIIVCMDKERNRKYRFFLTVTMSRLQLAKIITIKPYFVVINSTKHPLRFMEENEETDLWFDISPETCLPFWPDTDSLKMFVKHRDSKIVSQHFPINKPHSTVIRMDHGSALCVEVSCSGDAPTTITFKPYETGDAPVRVENLCEDLFFKIHQKSQGQVTLLSPYQSVLYTWDDPTLERTLIWNLYNRKKPGFPSHIAKDGYGHERLTFHSLRHGLPSNQRSKSPAEQSSSDDDDSESEDGVLLPKKTRKDKVVVYWVSYLDGQQRVLLFTQDERVARQAKRAIDGERAIFECFLSLNGIAASVVNGAYQEIANLSISSAPAVWEIEINHTWKLLTLELSAWLEDKWMHDQQKAELKDYLHVDLGKMHMTKPFFGHLRRFYNPAVWCQFRKSEHQSYVHLKLHRFQVDNQLPDAVFSTVVYPVPTPQSVVRRVGPKPFVEFSLLTHKSRDQNLSTIKYFKLLVQELTVRIDKGFLLSLYNMYSTLRKPKEEKSQLRADIAHAQAPLAKLQNVNTVSRSRRTVFEYVHISPLKISFSFSPRGVVYKGKPDSWSLQHDVLDFFLNSIGATLSEVKDIELRMAFFEKKGEVTTVSQLFSEIKSYYICQVIQQSYVLILGLDVVGNPYGLVKDFTQGLGDFFYEPFMGSIQGPEEFAEGLERGAQSLLGHVVGGTAHSVSLISGSLGQALAVLSFDEDYKKKRRQRLQQNPATLPETLSSAAKGFILGVVLGLSGVIVKPITGVQQEGVEGFFKGVGKGLMGLITKPAGGVMDMVSMAFDGIRRAAEMGEDVVVRLRLPRFVNPTMGVRPYSPYQATGYRLLFHLSKGHYAQSDIYWAHAALSKEGRADVAMVTDKHVFLLEKCRFWGGWDIEWVVRVDDIMAVPVLAGQRLVIKVRQDDSILNFTGDERYIQSTDIKVLEWLKEKIEKVLLVNMEDKPCPADV